VSAPGLAGESLALDVNDVAVPGFVSLDAEGEGQGEIDSRDGAEVPFVRPDDVLNLRRGDEVVLSGTFENGDVVPPEPPG
jgi:hypothetical protein